MVHKRATFIWRSPMTDTTAQARNVPSHTISVRSDPEPDLVLDTVALLAARYATRHQIFDPADPAPPDVQAARRAREEVAWAERIGRLHHLYAHLTDGVPHPTLAGGR